jgi:hypothetical protein
LYELPDRDELAGEYVLGTRRPRVAGTSSNASSGDADPLPHAGTKAEVVATGGIG